MTRWLTCKVFGHSWKRIAGNCLVCRRCARNGWWME